MGILLYCLAGLIVATVYILIRGVDVSYSKTIVCYALWPLAIAYGIKRVVEKFKGAEKRDLV